MTTYYFSTSVNYFSKGELSIMDLPILYIGLFFNRKKKKKEERDISQKELPKEDCVTQF